MQTAEQRLDEAVEVIEHDYAANAPSTALIYAAHTVLVELRAMQRRARAMADQPCTCDGCPGCAALRILGVTA